MSSEFRDFVSRQNTPRWLVKGLIPKGHLVLFIAPAGSGKSWLAEALGISVAAEAPIMGLPVEGGDVILVDEETPQDDLCSRLHRLESGIGPVKHSFEVLSFEGARLDSGPWVNSIGLKARTTALIILDNLTSLCGEFDTNSNRDMGKVGQALKSWTSTGATVVLLHHVAKHRQLSDGIATLIRGAQAIDAFADTEFVLWNQDEGGPLREFEVYPRPKKSSLELSKPFTVKLVENHTSACLEYLGPVLEPVSELDVQCYRLFLQDRKHRTVAEVYQELGHLYTEKEVRAALRNLDHHGALELKKEAHNRYKYGLPGGRSTPMSPWAERLAKAVGRTYHPKNRKTSKTRNL